MLPDEMLELIMIYQKIIQRLAYVGIYSVHVSTTYMDFLILSVVDELILPIWKVIIIDLGKIYADYNCYADLGKIYT